MLKRATRLLSLILLVSLVISSCAPEPKGALEQVLEHSKSFSQDIPAELTTFIARSQVNILGEYHWVKQTHEFYGQIIPGLHQAGIRLVMLEMPLAYSLVLDLYVTGQIIDFPWEKTVLEKEPFRRVVEAIKELNQSLRDNDQPEEQIRLYAIDMDLHPLDSSYPALIRVLRREAGLAGSFFHYPQDNLKQLDEGVVSGLSPELEQDLRWISHKQIEAEDEVRPHLWQDRVDDFNLLPKISEGRERILKENAEYFIKKHHPDKALIIIGAAHATRQDELISADTKVLDTHSLGRRFVDAGYDVNSLKLLHRQFNLTGLPMTVTVDSKLKLTEGDLLLSLEELYGDKRAWVDLRPLKEKPLPATIEMLAPVQLDKIDIDLAANYDGLILLPSVDLLVPEYMQDMLP